MADLQNRQRDRISHPSPVRLLPLGNNRRRRLESVRPRGGVPPPTGGRALHRSLIPVGLTIR